MPVIANALRILLVATCCVALSSCGSNWKTIDLPDGTTLTDVLSVDLYAPFDRSTLLRDPEEAYGEPRDSGSESKGKDYVFYKEYFGKHGRIRIYDEAYQSEEGWDSAQWLEVHPGKLYFKDVINGKYVTDVNPADGEWRLSLMPPDRSWCLTLKLDGKAIIEIADLPR